MLEDLGYRSGLILAQDQKERVAKESFGTARTAVCIRDLIPLDPEIKLTVQIHNSGIPTTWKSNIS